ncbi:MAG: ATP phosphoribosyltransferase [Candidatus Subteraquimicrobiales bacterium]|nr:ATP phosphoribosyltransferase [Candidatus Subteraquimicrobiales bacterium]
MNRLGLAVPKGELFGSTRELLQNAGFDVSLLKEDSRKLFISLKSQPINYLIARPMDIPTYVAYGAVDLGIVGKDVLMESKKSVYELLDLGYGKCRFVVAAPLRTAGRIQETYEHLGHLRVATKYLRVAEEYFSQKGVQVEIVKLSGNVEIAPLVNLADQIVDLVSTGRTLKENELVEVEEIAKSSARLIANHVSYKLKFAEISNFIEKIKKVLS